ncbi:MAG: immunoglobulin-like domain-containing protein, partial [Clostridia bacterium]
KWNQPASIISKLDDWFSKISIANPDQYLSKVKWKVGGVPYNAPTLLQTFVNLQGIDSTNLGGNFSGLTNYTSEVGTINTVDFIYTSDNKTCNSSYLETGSNNECAYNPSTGEINNFLQKSKYLYWTLNARSDVNNMAWNITNSGLVGSTIVNLTASSVRPVLNLKLDTKFLIGVGTIEDPYRLEDYMVNIDEAPQVTLIGDNPIYLHVGDTYNDPGVKVIDDVDGDISNSVTIISNVDTSKAGNYQVVYNAKDSNGNTAIEQTRNVIVLDKDTPTIILNGTNPLYVIVTSSYIEPGAKAIDPNYGDISGNIITTGSVDTSTIGNYYIDYNVTNADGLSAPTVTRKVIVKASTPTITLNGSSLKLVDVGTTYTEEGATANDSVFGDLTSSIVRTIEKYDATNNKWVISSSVETDDFNTYRIKYSVTNGFGANAFIYRNVSVVNVNGPEITYNPNGITTSNKKMQTVINVTKTNYDIDIASLKYFIYPPNTRLSYRTTQEFERYFKSAYKDGSILKIDGGTGYYTFYAMAKDIYKDTTYKMSNTFKMDNSAPIIYLNSGLGRVLLGKTYIDPGATAYDRYYDGNITNKIEVQNNVDTSKLGVYSIKYSVEDSAGNSTSVTRRVEVYHSIPKIALIGGSSIKIKYGTTFVEPGYTATDEVDGDLTSTVIVSGTVDSNKEGNYTLTYKVKNSSGFEGTNTRNVEVYIPSPVININGNKQIRILIGNTYTDLGATAIDELDGDLTSRIITTSNVDTSTAGTYKMTYTVTNNLGKTTTAERTVQVYIPNPVIQIKGNNPVLIYKNQAYIESGATATDELDGDLTSNIIIDTTSLRNTIAGTYKIKYSVTNSQGGVGTAERNVIVKKSLTEILLKGEDIVTLIKGANYTEPGYTARDEVDGDVTSKVTVSFDGLNLNKVGSYTIKYSYTNSGGDYYEAKRTIIVRNPKVEIAIKGARNINLPIGSPYIDEGATATDELLGDISSKIVVTTDLNTNVLGTYTVTYKVSSSEVDNQAVRTINIVPMAGPTITYEPNGNIDYAKSHSVKVTITKNKYDVDNDSFYYQWTTSTNKPLEESFTDTINSGDEITTPSLQSGKYYLWVIAKDVYGNVTELCSNSFNIDNIAPVLSLNGSKVVEMPIDSTYKDLGVSVVENDSGLNASGVVITTNIISSIIGKYTVTYNATDKAGNVAVSITRTVSVIEASLKDAPGDNYIKKYDSTYFVGANPNNWVLFGNAAESQYDYIPVYWRMIKADSNGIKIAYEGTLNDAKDNTNENGTIGLGSWDSINNTWNRPADIKNMLNNFYNNLKDDNKTTL